MSIDFNAICREAEKQKCPVHYKHATVKKETTGFSIENCCCDEFKEKMIKIVTDLFLEKRIDDSLSRFKQ